MSYASANSATASANSATASASSATSAAASYDSFDDRYLGAKSSEPSVDNDGDALVTGALFFDTTANATKVWTGSAWQTVTVSASNQTTPKKFHSPKLLFLQFSIELLSLCDPS